MFANAGPVESVRSIGHMQVRPMAPARRIATSGASNLPQTMVIVMHRAGAATNLTHDVSWLGHETVWVSRTSQELVCYSAVLACFREHLCCGASSLLLHSSNKYQHGDPGVQALGTQLEGPLLTTCRSLYRLINR